MFQGGLAKTLSIHLLALKIFRRMCLIFYTLKHVLNFLHKGKYPLV